MKHGRSYFFPLALIATGSIWLLNGMGIIPSENLWALTHLWPFLLIGWGLSLILGSMWRYGSLFMSLLLIIGAVLAILFAPQLGWAGAGSVGWNFDIGNDFGGSVKGSGAIKSETRKLADFETLSLDYPADVTIKQGTANSIVITADDNLLKQMSTEIKDGVLKIRNNEDNWNDRVKPSETVQIVITLKDVSKLVMPSAGSLLVTDLKTDSLELIVSGAGEISLVNLEVTSLDVVLSGAGDITADGVAESVGVRISGFGSFNGGDLHSQSAEVRITGAGSATIWVDKSLDASISGAGDVSYYGDPAVNESISGAGNVKSLGDK
ncbi:MAG: DUF2807 domain-containing protein [Anaerolineales bacterium]|nr:DUF2807 domain-containing protein [Anaerolineales bacterium]